MGLLATTGIQTRAKGGDSTLDAIFRAQNDLRTGDGFCEPEVVILNPQEFASIRLVKNADGNYLLGAAGEVGSSNVFGVRIVTTSKMPAGTALVANLTEGARAYVRQQPTVEVHPGGGGAAEFISNSTLIRAEERLATAVTKPECLCKVTGLAA